MLFLKICHCMEILMCLYRTIKFNRKFLMKPTCYLALLLVNTMYECSEVEIGVAC